jgi:hypothetical protein
MGATEVVNALLGGGLGQGYNPASITAPDPANPDGNAKSHTDLERSNPEWNSTTTRKAQILRAIVQSDQITQVESVNAFVATQYYGYLRRTPEAAGFNSWVNYLHAHPGDFRTMVHGFLNSQEYRLRVGPLVVN